MTVVLVHGNPEIPAVWAPLIERLGRDDVVTPQLPGFGAPAPEGFGATKEEYVAWLAGELEDIGAPVDLVGHDWGGGFALRIACTRPDLIRSWVSDVAGMLDPGYVWHDFAKLWQSDAAEQWVADTAAQTAEERAALLEAAGVTHDAASRSAPRSMPRWVAASSPCTGRRSSRRWPSGVATPRPPRLGRGSCSPRPTTRSRAGPAVPSG